MKSATEAVVGKRQHIDRTKAVTEPEPGNVVSGDPPRAGAAKAMTARTLVRQMADAGGRVWLNGDSVRIAANAALSNTIIEQLRRDKPKVVEVLRLLPVCCECGAKIIEPVSSWWGGRPVHLACGKAAWAREWQGEMMPAAAVAAKH